MKRSLLESGIFSGLILLASCTSAPATTGASNQSDTLVVFHTPNGVVTAPAASMSEAKLKELVDNFYPAVCFDDDADHDETPDTLDDDSDDCESRHGGASSTDGGIADADEDKDDDDKDDDDDDLTDGSPSRDDLVRSHRCETCNRGPGTQGDFRFEVDGDKAKLDRGRVLVSSATSLEVPGPQGTVTILIDASTELRGGVPTPGSEIRAEGTLQGPATARTFVAKRLEVLCPGPAPMSPADVPPGTSPLPVPPGGGIGPDGGVPTIN